MMNLGAKGTWAQKGTPRGWHPVTLSWSHGTPPPGGEWWAAAPRLAPILTPMR